MKKLFNILIALVTCLFSTSCNKSNESVEEAPDPHSGSIKSYHYELDQTEKILSELIKYFDEKDKESIKALFDPQTAHDCDLDFQIDKVFEIYDGKSISFEIDSGSELSKHVIDGKYVERYFCGSLENIRIDNDKSFDIWIARCVVDDDNPDNIGLNRITLKRSSDWVKIAPIGEVSKDEVFTYKY